MAEGGSMQNVTFETLEGFSNWLNIGEKSAQFPFGPKGWIVVISSPEDGLGNTVIRSPYYEVKSAAPYGAPKIFGHLIDFGGGKASGVVVVSPEGIINRRRLTVNDSLTGGQTLVCITNDAAPDRLEEPVAIVAEGDFSSLTDADWLGLVFKARDGVEVIAIREVAKWVKK